MAKNTFFDTIDEIMSTAEQTGIVHLTSENTESVGKYMKINGRSTLNFASCSYLSLETDARLKKGIIKAAIAFGSQFSSSRTYLSTTLYSKVQEHLESIFQKPVVIHSSTSACHIGVLPVLIAEEDVVIMDQQVHSSVQTAVNLLKVKGVQVDILRHNRLDLLEEKIKAARQKTAGKIWYLIDGVYSMFGDFAPMLEIEALLNRYDQFYLYADDAHGMSWAGERGSGFLLSKIRFHEKMVMATSLNKAFAGAGGVLVLPNKELAHRIRNCSAPYIYSGPIQPPMLGALVESAKIHLGAGLPIMQAELQEKIALTNTLLNVHGLPIVCQNTSPVFYIAAGLSDLGYCLVKRLLNDGFFTNAGGFPAVPVKNAGIRFTINRNHTTEEIKAFIETLAYHYPKALEEKGTKLSEVKRWFRMGIDTVEKERRGSNATVFDSIQKIDKTLWDKYLGNDNLCSWNFLSFLEKVFSNAEDANNHTRFFYFLVYDELGIPLVMSYFGFSNVKDDAFAHASISEQIEEKRKTNPGFLVSKALVMGSLYSEGSHIYVNRAHKNWRRGLKVFADKLSEVKEVLKADSIILRNFPVADAELSQEFLKLGFFKVPLASSFTMEELSWNNSEQLLSLLSTRNRRHLRVEVFKYESLYKCSVISKLNNEQLDEFYRLYLNVKNRSLEINTFPLPKNLFYEASLNAQFEFLFLKTEDEENRPSLKTIAVVLCYKNNQNFFPLIVGLDYDYLFSHGNYRQSIMQVLMRAKDLKMEKVFLGIGASLEKKKFGTIEHENVGFMQVNDNFNLDMLNLFQIQEKKKV